MQLLVPLVLALAALAFILMPLWGGTSPLKSRSKATALFSSDQLELDRELGKIDAAEYDELKPQVAANEAPKIVAPVEALIAAFRRQKRADAALEIEVMVARARRSK
jgi:hypothetical protein